MAKSTSRASLRNTTPPTVNTVGIRDFLRGAIYDLDQPTVVMSHSNEVGTWYPRGQTPTSNYLMASNVTRPPMLDSSSSFTPTMGTVLAASVAPTTPPVDVDGLNSAIGQLKEYLSRLPQADEQEEETNG